MRYGDGMSDPADAALAERLEALEVRFAFQEDLVRQLDEVVQTQADQIDSLQRDLLKMRTELSHEPESEAPPEEQVPPHY
jgi:SlyX protein